MIAKTPVEVSIPELEDIVENYLNAQGGVGYALKIVGHPGVGKSSIIRQIAKRRNHLFIDTRLAFKENIDLGGYPVPDHSSKKMVYYRPRFIPPETVPEEYDGIVWFLDESNRAHPTVIQTLFQIITERVCGEHQLPEKTAIILAGNLGEADHTTITEFDDAALDGRLAIFHLKPTARDWLKWAHRSEIHPSILHYITLFPERLWDAQHIHPNPRGWHQVSQTLSMAYGITTESGLKQVLVDHPDSALEKMIASLVGDIAGFDFISQQTSPRQLSTEDVIRGNSQKRGQMAAGEIVAEDVLWSISGAISYMREKTVTQKGELTPPDLTELGNILSFIRYARSDARVAFFYLLLKECGLLTRIPAAIQTIGDESLKEELTAQFDAFIEG